MEGRYRTLVYNPITSDREIHCASNSYLPRPLILLHRLPLDSSGSERRSWKDGSCIARHEQPLQYLKNSELTYVLLRGLTFRRKRLDSNPSPPDQDVLKACHLEGCRGTPTDGIEDVGHGGALRGDFKTQPPVDRRFRPVPGGCHCLEQ